MVGVSPNHGSPQQAHAPFLRSLAMKMAVERFEAVLRTDTGVLIAGEAGTGRELMARAIHRAAVEGSVSVKELLRESTRSFKSDRPFVIVDCAAADVEHALFGVGPASQPDSGDFDAISAESRLRLAVGGTLFLRQLHEMPARQQVRLARVLRDGEAWVRNGHAQPALVQVRARIIASIDPTSDGHDGRINHELRKRFPSGLIQLPPLRERREDIPGLVRHLLQEICASMDVRPKSISRQAIALLSALPWRGNISELRGLLRAVVAKVTVPLVRLTDVLEHIRLDGAAVAFAGGGTLKEARERFEREYVSAVLHQHRGRMAEAAKTLGIQRTNLYRKIRQLSVQRRPR